MKILLTNDDGIQSEGLISLASALKNEGHEVFVAAPTGNRSAVSHQLTMRGAISVEPRGENIYAIGGSPVDCVLISMFSLGFSPELVLAGINYGGNVGSDVLYSGTVAAALEGAQSGVPSVAVSQFLRPNEPREEIGEKFRRAAKIACENLSLWREFAAKTGALNVNFPDGEIAGIRVCPLSKTIYKSSYSPTEGGLTMDLNPPESTGEGDFTLLRRGYLTLTPLLLDLTDRAALSAMEETCKSR